jgi:hypothetical protein
MKKPHVHVLGVIALIGAIGLVVSSPYALENIPVIGLLSLVMYFAALIYIEVGSTPHTKLGRYKRWWCALCGLCLGLVIGVLGGWTGLALMLTILVPAAISWFAPEWLRII